MDTGTKRFLVAIIASFGGLVAAFAVAVLVAILPPWRGLLRLHEKLPAVAVEGGDTLYCRMVYCDYRFPLPAGARVVRVGPLSGGGDTIDGAIYVVGADGHPVDLRSYADLLQTKRFVARPTDGSGCEGVTSRMVDKPFVSGGEVIHYPLFDQFAASSPEQEGGGIDVRTEGGLTRIKFSYFGDL